MCVCFKERSGTVDGELGGSSAEFYSSFVLNPNPWSVVMQLSRLTNWKSILDDSYSAMEILKEVWCMEISL